MNSHQEGRGLGQRDREWTREGRGKRAWTCFQWNEWEEEKERNVESTGKRKKRDEGKGTTSCAASLLLV